jgi:hypothetical protein
VDAAGDLQSANGAVKVNSSQDGRYEVIFNRNVANCVYVATVAASGGQPTPDRGLVFTSSGSDKNTVIVETRDTDNALHPHPFNLQIRCSTGDSVVVANGGAIRGTNQPQATRTGNGQWEIRFREDVSQCSYVATIGSADTTSPPTGLIDVGSGQQERDAALVQTLNLDGTPADLPFHLQTRCRSTFAVVSADGKAVWSAGVADVRPGADAGTYEIVFKQNVSRCSYVAAIGDANGAPADPNGEVFVASGSDKTVVEVQTRKLDPNSGLGQLTNYPFHLQVEC